MYLKGLANNPKMIVIHSRLVLLYLDQKKFAEAEKHIQAIKLLNEEDWRVPFYHAAISAIKRQDKLALSLLEASFKKGFTDFELLDKVAYFKHMNENETYKKLINEYSTDK